jgi:hypothetical protein
MLFLLGLAVNSDILSQLFSWSLTIIFLFSIYAFCSSYLSAREGKLSTMIMCGVPLVVFYAAITYVDLGASLFVFLGIYAFMNWLNSRCKAWLFLSAATCGFSAGTKLSCALIPPLLLIAVAAGGLLSKQRPKKIALDLLQVSIICALFAAPWYIKAWISTGNPTYPFLYSFFGGKYWNIFSDSVYMKLTDSARVKSIKDLLSLPWRWTFGAFDASIGALLPVGLAIVLLRLKKMPRSLRPVLFISFLLLVSFALFTNQPRFYFAVFACWSIAIACEFNRTWPTGRLTGFLLAAFLFLLSFCWNLDTKRHKLSAALGLSPREEFLARSIPFYRQFQWMNNNLGFDCRILIWSGHPYSLDKDYVEVIPIQGLIDFSRIKDGPGLLERMRELGVTHLFYAPRERTTYPVVGGLLDFLHDDLVKTGRLVLVKKWTFAEILNNSQVVDTMLYRVSY